MTDIAQDFAPDFRHDAAAVHTATARLLTSAAELDETDLGEPCLLPEWTRGHLLAHVARNADAVVNLLTWARTGTPVPMYASATAREADIARDAGRPLAAHLDDLRTTAERFDEAAAALPPDRWSYEVEMRNGVVEPAGRLAMRRLMEIELHHLDLGVGYTLHRLPASFVDRALGFLTTVKFAGRADMAALELHPGDGRALRTGGESGASARVEISGSPVALVGWLTGRTKGDDVVTSTGAALPPIPPL